jgi:hypothetical protein
VDADLRGCGLNSSRPPHRRRMFRLWKLRRMLLLSGVPDLKPDCYVHPDVYSRLYIHSSVHFELPYEAARLESDHRDGRCKAWS